MNPNLKLSQCLMFSFNVSFNVRIWIWIWHFMFCLYVGMRYIASSSSSSSSSNDASFIHLFFLSSLSSSNDARLIPFYCYEVYHKTPTGISQNAHFYWFITSHNKLFVMLGVSKWKSCKSLSIRYLCVVKKSKFFIFSSLFSGLCDVIRYITIRPF